MARSGAAGSSGRPKVVTRSEAETHALGERLGRVLEAGDFVGLVGPMGAGKTAFVRGVAKGAGVNAGEVASPTFAIAYAYRGRVEVDHVDLYRVEDAEELYATGYFDFLDGTHAVLVEWLDRIPEAAPAERLEVNFRDLGGDRRQLTFTPHGIKARARLAALGSRRR